MLRFLFLISSYERRNRAVCFVLLVCLLTLQPFLPVWADEGDALPLRGVKNSTVPGQPSIGGGSDAPSPTNDDEDVPVFSPRVKRVEPPDPGMVPNRSIFVRLPLTEFEADRLQIDTTPPQNLIPVGRERLNPIKLEASYTESITLKGALRMARESSLPIQISQTNVAESRYNFFGTFGNFVPSMSMNYTPQFVESGNTTVRSSPYFITLIYPVFLGGAAIFTTLERNHELKAARNLYTSSINDILLDTYLKYYDLLRDWALLNLRSKALDVATTQLSINKDLKIAGMGTDFEVMQAKTLYSLEKQRLVRQEVNVRRAAIQLCVSLNKSVMLNVIPTEREISKRALVEPEQTPEFLTTIAVQNRPELARFEELRLAARNAARAAASPLLPRAAFFTNNSINIGGSGSSIIIPTGGGSSAGGITSSAGGSANSSFSGGFILNWLLQGAGIENASNVMAARIRTRRAVLQAQEEILKISAEVRDAYLDTRADETELEVTSDAVASATEQLRMANLRLTHQVGTNLEVIQAERDYIDANTRRIEAFINFRKSQGRLLHATGLISVDSLTADTPQRFQLKRGK